MLVQNKKSIYVLLVTILASVTVYHFVDSKRFLNQHKSEQKTLPNKLTESNKKTPEERALYTEERAKFEFDMQVDPRTGIIPKDQKDLEFEQARKAETFDLRNSSYVSRGPSNLGGRTRAIVFDSRDANIIISGGVSSGVFRSTNAGTSWTKVSSNDEIHNVTAIAQDTRPGHEDTWYYGTGEASGNSAGLGAPYQGNGIWKSTNNGLSWTLLANTQGNYTSYDIAFDYTNRLIVDPTNGDVYAAASDVILRSTDGGVNWNIVLGSLANNNYTDIVVTSTGRLYAAFHGNDGSEGVHTSTDGTTWTKIAGTGATANHANWNVQSAYGRVVLAVAPSNEDKLYALYYNNTVSNCSGTPAPEAELFVWSQSGSSWTDLSANLPNEGGCSNGNDPFACQGGYDLCIAVKPDDENTVFIGGTNAYRSTDGWTTSTNYDRIGGYASSSGYAQYSNHHPDIHTFVFAPGDNDNLYSGSDGGIAKADITVSSGAVSWTEINNDYVTYQYYHVDIMPANGSTVLIGGAQDNGTTECASETVHGESFGGDGCAVGAISYTDSNNYNIIGATQNGNLFRFIANGGFGYAIRPTGVSSSIFVTYFHLDQDNTNILYYCDGQDLYRTRIASSITNGSVTGNASTGWERMSGVNTAISGNIRSLATSRNDAYGGGTYSASDANRTLYIGTDNGQIFRLNDPAFVSESTTPTAITPSSAGSGIVSGISVKADDQSGVMATWSNYNIDSCFFTSDASVASPSWSNVEGNLSAHSFRSTAVVGTGDDIMYYVGTARGLYSTSNLNGSSTTWSRESQNKLGYALVSSLRYRPSDGKLAIGTHGNGIFETTTLEATAYNTWTGSQSSDWNDTDNWSDGVPTSASDVLVSNQGISPILDFSIEINSLTIVDSDASMTVTGNGVGLTINEDVVNNGSFTINSPSSLIIGGSSTVTVTYNRNIPTTNWYLVSAPVEGQTIVDFYTDESPALGSGTGNTQNVAIAPYDNAQASGTDRWNYYTEGQVDGEDGDDTSDTFSTGTGYAIKMQASGDVAFTGTLRTNDVGVSLSDGSGSGGNAFNFIGNPYTSYISVSELIEEDNVATGNEALLSQQTIWLWDQSANSYVAKNLAADLEIAPGQGFFVLTGSAGTFDITEAMQSHSADTFFTPSSNRPEINLTLTNESETRAADIYYIDGTTTGFDNGYDSSIFGGFENEFAMYTHEVTTDSGRNLGIQSLPDNDYENMIIPVGINATSGMTISISASSVNLPTGIKLYLQDTSDNSFTLLENDSKFTTTLTSDLNGSGRFYLYTALDTLGIDSATLNNMIGIYTPTREQLRIVGVQSGAASVVLYNTLGKQVLKTAFQGQGANNIALPTLASGVYVIKLTTESGIINRKIILN